MHVPPRLSGSGHDSFHLCRYTRPYQLPLKSQLLEYRKLDTFATVRLLEFFRGRSD